MGEEIEAMGVTPMAWSEVLPNAERTPKNSTIIQAWRSPNASTLAAGGRAAIESAPGRFYMAHESTPQVTGAWSDIGPNHNNLVLGGEVAVWTGTYCYMNDCVRPHSPNASGHAFFARVNDEAFSKSV